MALNCYGRYEDADTKRLQVIYLREVKKLPPKKISEYVDYALSTIRNYIWRFRDWIDRAIALFEKGVEIILDKKKEFYAYIFYIKNRTSLMYLKIGFSNNPKRRMKELLTTYGATSIEPVKIYKFEDEDSALTMENTLRKYFKSKEGSQFVPRDRFQNILCEEKDISILDSKYNFILNNF